MPHPIFSRSISNDMDELTRLMQAVHLFLEPRRLAERALNAVDLVLEEIITNIIKYGYEDTRTHTIRVSVEVTGEGILFTFEDDGKAFNPLALPWPDHSKPAMERFEDGLGIYFVRKIKKSMEYRREAGRNIVKIEIPAATPTQR